jgi:serine/threonine protein kinase
VKTGQRLAGRYEIQDLLGHGGMGEVWRARDLTLDRPVAVKTLSSRLSVDELQESLPRFQREGRAAARLNHPSIATIFDAGEHDGQLFMVLEFVDGEDLRRVLARQPAGLPVGQVLDIGAQVAEGLTVAHEAGVVHRDAKPANIMLLSRGRVKVCDFGIARLEGMTSVLSVTGTVVGTMDYMPRSRCSARRSRGAPMSTLSGRRSSTCSRDVSCFPAMTCAPSSPSISPRSHPTPRRCVPTVPRTSPPTC